MGGLNITKPVWQERDVAGNALSYWFLEFYQINSDVKKDVYEDIQRKVPICQPVQLNDQGWAALFAGEGDYTVRVYDKDMVLKNCYDMQGASGSSASGGFAIVPTMQAMRELVAGSVSYVVVQGYTTYGDGCGGEFDWIPTASNPDNGVNWFAPVSFPAEGRYQRRNATALTMKMAGDPGNLDSSLVTLNRLIEAASPGDNIVFPPGTYKLNNGQVATIPKTLFATAEAGAKIFTDVSGGISFLGSFFAPPVEVFTGELNVEFGDAQPSSFAEWFGAVGDNDTDDTDAFLALFASGVSSVVMPSKTGYKVTTNVAASVPMDTFFWAFSDLTYATGPVVIIPKGQYSRGGQVAVATIRATLAYIGTVSGNLIVTGGINANGTIQATDSTSDMVAGRDVVAGFSGAGSLKARAGTSLQSGKARVRIGQWFGSVGNAGSAETVLAEFYIAGNSLVDNGDTIYVRASGFIIQTGVNKRVRLRYGGLSGAILFDSGNFKSDGAQSTNDRWDLDLFFAKTGTNAVLIGGAFLLNQLFAINFTPTIATPTTIIDMGAARAGTQTVALGIDSLLTLTGQGGSSNDVTGKSLTADCQPNVTNFTPP